MNKGLYVTPKELNFIAGCGLVAMIYGAICEAFELAMPAMLKWFSVIMTAFVAGCSSMQIETETQKYNDLKQSLPANICLIECESREEYPESIRKYFAFTKLDYMPGKHAIWTLKGNACLLEHEIKHTTDGPGHEGWSRRLMECSDHVEMG